MTINTPIEDLAPETATVPGPTSSSVSQPAADHFSNCTLLSDGMDMLLSLCNGVGYTWNSMYNYINGSTPTTRDPVYTARHTQSR